MFIDNSPTPVMQDTRIREISTVDVTLNRQDVSMAVKMAGWKWIYRFKSLEFYGQFETIINTIKHHGNGRIKLANFLPDLVDVADLKGIEMDSTASLSELMNVRPKKPYNEITPFPWQNRDGWLTNKSPSIGDTTPPVFTITSSTSDADCEGVRALIERAMKSDAIDKQWAR